MSYTDTTNRVVPSCYMTTHLAYQRTLLKVAERSTVLISISMNSTILSMTRFALGGIFSPEDDKATTQDASIDTTPPFQLVKALTHTKRHLYLT